MRLSPREKKLIQDADDKNGVTMTNFVISDPRLGEAARGAYVVIDRPDIIARCEAAHRRNVEAGEE